MPTIRISNFQGTIPAISPKLLEQNQAQTAENCRLNRGIIEPLKDMSIAAVAIQGGPVVDSDGDIVVAGKYSLRSATYKWTDSGTQAGEYHVELAGGGDPGLNEPVGLMENGSHISTGTLGSLTASTWAWGNNDTLGYNTVYVRTTDTADPDGKAVDYIQAFEDKVVSGGQAASIYLMDDAWLHWPGDVDVVKSFIPDSDLRIYFTGDVSPKQTNDTLATSGAFHTWPTTTYPLGVTAPTVPLTAAQVSGGTHAVKTVVYVYTYVTAWGEESAPSPPSNILDVTADYYVHIDGFTAGGANVTHIRLYRLNTGTALAEYQLVPYPVDNITAYSASTDYVLNDRVTYQGLTYICLVANGPGSAVKAPTETDYWSVDVDDCEIADALDGAKEFDDKREDSQLAEIIAVEDWDVPPADLAGLHLFVNNIVVGFSGNEVYPSVPSYPYAYPAKYAMRCDYDVVAIAHYGETLVVLTESKPYIGIGTDPASMTLKPLPYIRPCLAKKGAISSERGVIYPSDDGFWIINASGGRLLSKNLFTKEQWEAKSIADMICAYWDDKLYTFLSATNIGFYIDMDDMRVIDFTSVDKAFYDAKVIEDFLYVLVAKYDYDVYSWEQASTELTYTWKSKKFQNFSPLNFNVGRVIADGAVTMKLYVDDVLKHTESVTDDSIFRMPSGYRGKVTEIEVTGTSDIDIVAIATSIDELLEG